LAHKIRKEKEITRKEIIEKYGFTPQLIKKYLPKPRTVRNPYFRSGAPLQFWKESDVQRAAATIPEIKKQIKRRKNKQNKEKRKIKDAEEFLKQFSPEMLIEEGKQLERRFFIHVGPTNSGKTYESLCALKKADTGVYLGPLRLLALEVAENLNYDGVLCSLLTGEESIPVPGATIVSSTIELCDYNEHYDVAVIDEAQMIADPFRGPNWTRAISLIDADEVHICLAPEALPVIENIVKELGSEYSVVQHERLVPFEFAGFFRDITDVEPGDALIAFSRKKVLQIAAALEKQGIKASVIYGALPPESRREEVRRFAEKETSVVVSTDAIGMGISLPIKRVIFTEVEKFDGNDTRKLNFTEIKQIAGRAGRYKMYDLGQVLTMSNVSLVKNAINSPAELIKKITIGFPKEALDYDYPLENMLKIWDSLPENELFVRADMRDAEFLLSKLKKIAQNTTKEMIYSLITCPIDIKNDKLVKYYTDCCHNIINNMPVIKPYFKENTLESCELKYHAYDVYHQLMRRIGIEDDCKEEKENLSKKINDFLKSEKTDFLKRCRICGKILDVRGRFSICDECYNAKFHLSEK
jgi:ATP-dependent RNA helicase SUPV3L1/SUV3